jgi:hypothetical protein
VAAAHRSSAWNPDIRRAARRRSTCRRRPPAPPRRSLALSDAGRGTGEPYPWWRSMISMAVPTTRASSNTPMPPAREIESRRDGAAFDARFALAKEAPTHDRLLLPSLVHSDRPMMNWPDARNHAGSHEPTARLGLEPATPRSTGRRVVPLEYVANTLAKGAGRNGRRAARPPAGRRTERSPLTRGAICWPRRVTAR